MSTTPPQTTTPCYRQAFYRKQLGQLTEKEYFHWVFQHVSKTGVKHKNDHAPRGEIEDDDPLGYVISCWVVNTEPVDDPTPFEDVFAIYRRSGTVDELKTALAKTGSSEPYMRHSLALLALRERNARVLKWLLDDGFTIVEAFEDEVRRVTKKKDAETWKLLQDAAAKSDRPWAKTKRPRYGHPLD